MKFITISIRKASFYRAEESTWFWKALGIRKTLQRVYWKGKETRFVIVNWKKWSSPICNTKDNG